MRAPNPPDTILHLSVRLARAYGLRPQHAACTLGLAALASLAVGISHRAPSPATPPSPAHTLPARVSQSLRLDDPSHSLGHPAVVATDDGWLVAYARSTGLHQRHIELVSLHRDGTLAQGPTRLSPAPLSDYPVLTRAADRYALAWISVPNPDTFSVVASFALVDAHGTLHTPARRLESMGTQVFGLAAAYNGHHLAFAAKTFEHDYPVALALRGRDGSVVADRRLPAYATTLGLTNLGDQWLLATARHTFWDDRTALSVQQLSPLGDPLETLRLGRVDGEVEHLQARSRGRATALWWAQDASHRPRHQPFFARLDGIALDVGPEALGPRQTASARDLACDDTHCTLTWVERGPRDNDRPEWFLERRTRDGHRIATPLRLPARGGASLYAAPVLAARPDGRAMLAVLPLLGRDHAGPYGLLVQPLDAEGRPQGAPQPLPL